MDGADWLAAISLSLLLACYIGALAVGVIAYIVCGAVRSAEAAIESGR